MSTIPSLTAVIVAAVLVYLSTFVVLAILRVATGISIQRVGYLSLNHVTFSPSDGITVWIRITGVSFHRPSVAHPTWMSVRIGETRVTVNLRVLAEERENKSREEASIEKQTAASLRNIRRNSLPPRTSKSKYTHTKNESSVSTTGSADNDGPDFGGSASPAASRRCSHSHLSSRHDRRPSASPTASTYDKPSNKLWSRLSRVTSILQKLHRYVNYLALIDIYATDTTLQVLDAGELHVGSFRLRVDTRRKVFEQGRLFRAQKSVPGSTKSAEWIFIVRRVLANIEGHESIEILDNVSVNIHGTLSEKTAGLSNVGIATKAGRLHVPCDYLEDLSRKLKKLRGHRDRIGHHEKDRNIFDFARKRWTQEMRYKENQEQEKIREDSEVLDDMSDDVHSEVHHNDRDDNTNGFGRDSPNDADSTASEDLKLFLSSVLRGLQEVQMGLSSVRLTRTIGEIDDKTPLYLTVVTHEMALDVHQIEPHNPAHKMYFQPDDIAHQALLAAMSCSVSLEDGAGLSDRVMYIPMTTMTIKTTLLSRLVCFMQNPDVDERNSNVLFANLVVTSPAVDLEPKHISQLVTLLQNSRRQSIPQSHHKNEFGRALLTSHLLPKASIKTSIQEPVLRFIIPANEDIQELERKNYHLLVSSISSSSLDIETIHTSKRQYSLSATYRLVSHLLYYHTAGGSRCRLLTIDSFDLKTHINATPEIAVVASGNLNTFSIHLQSGEVSQGIVQIVHQYVNTVQVTKPSKAIQVPRPKFLRRLPHWLLQFQFEITALSVEVAGVDESLGPTTRGIVLQVAECSADYQSQKHDTHKYAHGAKRRTPSYSALTGENSLRLTSTTSSARRQQHGATDGRRIAIHVKDLEGFIIESAEYMEQESFLLMPRFEVALNTSSDLQGPIFHVNTNVKSVYLSYSLYRHYAVGLALCVVHDVFQRPFQSKRPVAPAFLPEALPLPAKAEKLTVDVKIAFMQIKATMPADPPLMLRIYSLAAGSYRWSPPFVRCALLRLHAGAPKMKGIWARIVSISNLRVGFRHEKKAHHGTAMGTPDINVTTDFVRLAVPHLMVMHHVFDNFVNVAKACKQLHHRFKTQTNEYILEKSPEKPKNVPHITVRSKAVLFELEDDAFEYKLSRIYRLGLLEQRQRLAREEAFHLKIRKLDESNLKQKRSRTLTTNNLQPPPQKHKKSGEERPSNKRSKSTDAVPQRPTTPKRSRSDSLVRERRGRYDPQGASQFTDRTTISRDDAWHKLQVHNARSWKARIDNSSHSENPAVKGVRQIFATADELPAGVPDDEDNEVVLSIPTRPGLMSALVTDLNLEIDKPSFPVEEYGEFLHRIGKGMPKNMQYSLLVPLSIHLDMGESRVTLRDYPLDLLHIPPLRHGQSSRSPCWSLRTDFVIAEEYRDYQSARQVMVNIIPPDSPGNSGFNVDVRRTVSPVKMYSDATFEIHTKQPTVISWGMSYQPVIQDMMKIIEGFTKPEIDPSERVGFWDKIRLCFHSRINILWKGDGDVHLRLKGSPDPYVVTGFGAGFVMCWRKDVQWEVHTTDDPREFMKVTSGEYVLAIPDYSHEARHTFAQTSGTEEPTTTRPSLHDLSPQSAPVFKKVIMKLSGNVRWLLGLVFERNYNQGARSFDFRPHYGVILRNPKFISEEWINTGYDAYNGFRSNHIHMSVAVVAPVTRVWSLQNREPSASYNTVHLTPKFFTHFYSWWCLFSGVMSLPVRQGPLFPGITKSSKKFGRHLATVKYNLFLSPLFVAHIYRHRESGESKDGNVAATGIKLRLDSFMLDLHHRREQVRTTGEGRLKQNKSSQMKINKAQLDFINADFRAVSVSTSGSLIDDVENVDASEATSSFSHQPSPIDLSRFKIPDRDFSWVDMDDFVELDWMMWTASQNPKTQILPLAFSPRFSYYRETDSQEIPPGETGYSPFGDEPTHYCVLSDENDPRKVQFELIKERLETIEAQIASHEKMIELQQSRVTKEADAADGLHKQYELLLRQGEALQHRRSFLRSWLHRLESQFRGDHSASGTTESDDCSAKLDYENLSPPEIAEISDIEEDLDSDFNNRFSIHNVQMKWNNSLRNIILRYMHQVSQRRGFVYYMSRRAVKFILDIVEEQSKTKIKHADVDDSSSDADMASLDNELSVEDRIEQLLGDARRFVEADEENKRQRGRPKPPRRSVSVSSEEELYDISPDFTAINSYHVRLITPQIQLQSDKNTKAVALVTAKGMQLKVISVMDNKRESDDINSLVQRRFTCDMDSAQFFVATRKSLLSSIHMYSGNRYGNAPGSAWPPWVPLESMLDFDIDPTGFSRIIQKTSASLRYDKYNTLRLKYNDSLASTDEDQTSAEIFNSLRNRIDRIQVDFPHVRAICDSTQYYSMYIIVLDLLMYNEPLEKVRNEKLEKIMLASDFSDLRGAPEMVEKLQQRVQQIEDLKRMFQVQSNALDPQGWKDRVALESDLAQCEDELFFIVKAITTSQRKSEERNLSDVSGVLRWGLAAKEIVWHLMTDSKEPLAEFQLGDARYERTDNIDGSNYNLIEVRSIYGLNLLPSALYPEMIAPYLDDRKTPPSDQDLMLNVEWFMLEAIAGIPVLDNFEVKLFPLKVQLERDMAKKLFEYIFPGIGSNAFDGGGFSPFLVRPMGPLEEEASTDDSSELTPNSPDGANEKDSIDIPSDPKPIEQRLHPTLTLTDTDGLTSPSRKSFGHRHRDNQKENEKKEKEKDTKPKTSEEHSKLSVNGGHHKLKIPVKKPSIDNLKFLGRTNSDKSTVSNSSAEDKKKHLRSSTFRSMKGENKSKEISDDLSQMVSRASNYMILTHVKVSDVVLCLSYKGKGGRNIEDVHNFVFRMPVLEYRNKTWSNLELALRLKKDVMKALISHAPAILGNKFHHRPTKQQQMHFRELATNSQVLNGSSTNLSLPNDSSSMYSFTPGSDNVTLASLPLSSGASIFSNRPRTAGTVAPRESMATIRDDDGDHRTVDEKEKEQKNFSPPRKNIMRRLTGDFHDRQPLKDTSCAVTPTSPHHSNYLSSLGRKLLRHDSKAADNGTSSEKSSAKSAKGASSKAAKPDDSLNSQPKSPS
ncbi:hypothetical protein KEM56_002773 [Ascosphaera pollenicola]|nr:hypothetical protein KEM56_002773 [Ascosphaera pollenicola]